MIDLHIVGENHDLSKDRYDRLYRLNKEKKIILLKENLYPGESNKFIGIEDPIVHLYCCYFMIHKCQATIPWYDNQESFSDESIKNIVYYMKYICQLFLIPSHIEDIREINIIKKDVISRIKNRAMPKARPEGWQAYSMCKIEIYFF